MKGYNLVLDFIYYYNKKIFLQDAHYWVPACLMKDMHTVIDKIQEDIKEYRGHQKIQDLSEHRDNNKEIWSIPEFLGHVNRKNLSLGEFCDLEKKEDTCRRCLLKKDEYHAALFGKYCKLHVMRNLYKFQDAMTRDKAEVLYIKYFSRALHAYSFFKFNKFVNRSKVMYPSVSLSIKMDDLLKEIQDMHLSICVAT